MIHKLGTYKVRTNGRGAIITIPTIGLDALSVKQGDSIDMHMEDDAIIITKAVQLHPIFAGIVAPMKGTE